MLAMKWYIQDTSSIKDAVPNLLICCRFDLAGGKNEKQENEQVVHDTMMARRCSK
jgi:hypothetical protein